MLEDPNRLPNAPEPTAPGGDKRNISLWVGLGCLSLVILSCCLLSYWAQTFGFRWILNQGEETRSWASRLVLTGALEAITDGCVDGMATEEAQRWFHPNVTSEARNRLCRIDEATIQEIATPDRVPAESLAATGEPELAERFGMDPALCYRYATETVRIIGCFERDAQSGAIPYKIIGAE
jgi:hypothetical protein